MKVVDENTVVEVGKFYNVRCAIVIDDSVVPPIEYVEPIVGEAHKDPQLGVPYKHYHKDGRFANTKHPLGYYNKDGLSNNVLCTEKDKGFVYVKDIVIRKLKCKRLTTGLNPPHPSVGGDNYWSWYKSYVGKSCKGKRCPHLGTAMHERDGKWVCPLHNLTGDPKTERIIEIDFAKPEPEIVKTFKDMLGI